MALWKHGIILNFGKRRLLESLRRDPELATLLADDAEVAGFRIDGEILRVKVYGDGLPSVPEGSPYPQYNMRE